ncbi:hypothetical protein ED733_001307 [Metarhizium rileyi]|uniref:D-isomer specific 2-hydroxyacid dehydrogenase NAD-binding domain-containing protein n=1 Tax=Metarhizium rileyi (strain RCEF 4871) TaxID=1649241 RepID=A0A5C6FYT6_METRR|nr:hypothetical protein ED733_001307 [Metarhizium rileyi]
MLDHVDRDMSLEGHKLLITGPWRVPPPPAQIAHIQARFPKLVIEVREKLWTRLVDSGKEEDQEKLWKDVTILVTQGELPDAAQAPRLQYVQLWTAGAEQVVNKPAFKDTRITFCTANGVHGPPVAEWVMTTFLAWQQKIPTYLQLQRRGNWNRLDEISDDSVDKRVGILGYGSIGRQVARVAKALGMDVYAYTLHARPTPESRRDDSYVPPGLGDPEGTLPSLDLLVVAIPLTCATRGLIAQAELNMLRKSRTFVANISRGSVLNTNDLVQALNDGVIGGAALDVTDPEPLVDGHPLWTSKNVIITPHISGVSAAYGKRVMDILELNLERLSRGKKLKNVVRREAGY